MKEIIIIETASAEKLKNALTKSHIEHQVIYNQPLTSSKPSSKKNKLKEYIEMKSKENIFANYGEAIKDKEREKEAKEWDEMEVADWD